MGRWKALALVGLLAVLLSALLAPGAPAGDAELLVNGDFEEGIADPWIAKGGALQVVDDLGRDGSVAGVFATDGGSYHYVRQCVPASEDSAYTFQGHAAAPNETPLVSVYLLVRWYAEAECYGQELGISGDEPEAVILEPAGAWHSLILDIAAVPAASRSARVGIVIQQSDAIVYLDDFSFTGPPAPTPSPSPTQTPSPTATPSPSPTVRPSPSPEPTAPSTPSPTAAPSPTAGPIATEPPSTAMPSPSTQRPAAGLVNGGFEEAEDDGQPVGWRKYGGELSRSSAAAWEGQFAAAFTSRTASTKWVFQTVALEGGAAYVLSGYALKNDVNVEGAYLRLSWYASPDGSGKAIDNVDSTTRLTDDSRRFRSLTTGPVVAPVEAASAKVRLMLGPRSEAEGTVYFDAISFDKTAMPSQPVDTPQPSPASASSETPAASPVLPAPAPEQPEPSSSPDLPHRSPTVLGATAASQEPTVSVRDESSQSETDSEGRPARTPVVLYRERRADQSAQGGEGVAGAGNESDAFSPIVVALAAALPAAAAATVAFFVWRRWRQRARPP